MRFSAWNAKISTSVSSSAKIVTGWNFGRNLCSNQSLPCDLSKSALVSQPAASGITMKTTTEVIRTLLGTTTFATPHRNITMGAKATSMMRSFTATCTSV